MPHEWNVLRSILTQVQQRFVLLFVCFQLFRHCAPFLKTTCSVNLVAKFCINCNYRTYSEKYWFRKVLEMFFCLLAYSGRSGCIALDVSEKEFIPLWREMVQMVEMLLKLENLNSILSSHIKQKHKHTNDKNNATGYARWHLQSQDGEAGAGASLEPPGWPVYTNVWAPH